MKEVKPVPRWKVTRGTDSAETIAKEKRKKAMPVKGPRRARKGKQEEEKFPEKQARPSKGVGQRV